jgi:gallate dioxygenase
MGNSKTQGAQTSHSVQRVSGYKTCRGNKMAKIVAAFGVPHTPAFPQIVSRDGTDCEIAQCFSVVRDALEQARPDVIVMFTTDHLNTFFFDALPIFAIGVDEGFSGPSDYPPAMAQVRVPSNSALAAHIRNSAIGAGFDVALARGVTVDHSVMVPLHFLAPENSVSCIPVFINGHIPPLPSAMRCHDFGTMIGTAIDNWPDDLRVVVIGSGSFSLEVHGPRMLPGLPFGVPDTEWGERVCNLLAAGDIEQIIQETTPERLDAAGNVAGEILNWIAMMGVFGPFAAQNIRYQPQYGHAYGVWITEQPALETQKELAT